MPNETQGRYLFVAIDRATRWVWLEIQPTKEAKVAAPFLDRLVDQAPFKITQVLTDNCKEFTGRFCATGEREPTGRHVFDWACRNHGVDHRLIPPYRPQTNGMVERFNGRIAEIVKTTRFQSGRELEQILSQYAKVYNHQIPQKALGHIAPIQAIKKLAEHTPRTVQKTCI